MIETGAMPGPPPYPAGPPRAGVPGRRPVQSWDLALAIVLYFLAAALGAVAAYFTLFFAFAADPCGVDDCRPGFLAAAFAVSWGGIVLALLGSLALIVVAAVRGRRMWFWPLLAIPLIAGAFLAGLILASQVYTGA